MSREAKGARLVDVASWSSGRLTPPGWREVRDYRNLNDGSRQPTALRIDRAGSGYRMGHVQEL